MESISTPNPSYDKCYVTPYNTACSANKTGGVLLNFLTVLSNGRYATTKELCTFSYNSNEGFS